MKKYFVSICLMMFIVLGLTACGASKLDESFDEGKLKASAEQVLDNLNNEKYEEIAMCVDESVKDKLTADTIGNAWNGLKDKFGEYNSIDSEKVTGKDGAASVVIISKYEKSKMMLTVSYNKDMKIIGLFIK